MSQSEAVRSLFSPRKHKEEPVAVFERMGEDAALIAVAAETLIARLNDAYPWLAGLIETAVNAEDETRVVRLGEAVHEATNIWDLVGVIDKSRVEARLLGEEVTTLGRKVREDNKESFRMVEDVLEAFAFLAEIAAHAHERAASPPAPSK